MNDVPHPSSATPADPADDFVAAVFSSLQQQRLLRLVLSKPRSAADGLKRVVARPVLLKGLPHLSVVASHTTRDITSNLDHAAALVWLRDQCQGAFAHAQCFATDVELELLFSKKGKSTLLRRPVKGADPAATVTVAAHDREKHRWVSLDRPYLSALGVTDANRQLVPAMSRKWKQINRFVEVLDRALAASPLAQRPPEQPLHVVDFGAGKGYLTFAVHDHLQRSLGRSTRVTGVELREDLVSLCNGAIASLGIEGLRFDAGDVRTYTPEAIDVMIALHACDTATDHAIHLGLRAGASIILCSPCCHKQIRPQLMSPHPMRGILQHGVHLGQEAEMVTDGLRALLLEAAGYDTQVFEFISLEHTNKNKMILAVKRSGGDAAARDKARSQIDEVKGFYGIREHCLESLLAEGAASATKGG